MKIQFNTILQDKQGKPIKDNDKPDGHDVTLGYCAEIALFATFQSEAMTIDGATKAQYARLALRIDGETDVSHEEIVLIKDRIGKAFGPLIVARCYDILDGADHGAQRPKAVV